MLTLKVSIIRDKQFKFTNKGSIKIKCPKCYEPLEIVLKGLADDESVTPCVEWVWNKEKGEQAEF